MLHDTLFTVLQSHTVLGQSMRVVTILQTINKCPENTRRKFYTVGKQFNHVIDASSSVSSMQCTIYNN